MFKNKLKIIAIFITLTLLFSTSFVLADNDTVSNSEASTDKISVDSSNTNELSTENKNIEQSASNTSADAQTQEDSYKKNDVYLTGEDVTVDYIVDGNLFVCANKVTINSQIGGDAFILAKELVINDQAYIFSNLFTCAQSVEIKGVVYDVYACAQDFTISSGYIYRDMKLSCQNVNINGTVGRNAFVNCSSINFNTDSQNKGIIYGNLDYTSSSEASIPDGSVSGEVKFEQSSDSNKEDSVKTKITSYILNLGAFLAFVLIIWLLCLWLAPKFLDKTNEFVGKKTWKVLGIGFITLIAIPIACIFLLLLQITASTSLLILVLYILALVVSKSLFTITANKYLCTKININKNSGIFGMLIVSGIIIWVLTKLPYVGGILSFVVTILGLGILVSAILPKKIKKNIDKKDSTTLEENN